MNRKTISDYKFLKGDGEIGHKCYWSFGKLAN